MSAERYVILEWNQAGGFPKVVEGELYDDQREAAEQAHLLTVAALPRQDRYTVHPVDLDERVPWRVCPECKGTGGGPGQQDADCDACHGSGVELNTEEGR